MNRDVASHLDLENVSAVWDDLRQYLEAFLAAWESSQGPPELRAYLPGEPPALRQIALVELIKIDLEFRWQTGGCPKRVEEYAEEFPELSGEFGLPCDLIYEEYHVRQRSDAPPTVQEYRDRFPDQAASLVRLLDLDSPNATTHLVPGAMRGPPPSIEPVEDFELLQTLGSGSFATVYLARQRSMQRLVALKVTAPRGDEPQTMAQLDHPNIVRVIDQRLAGEPTMRFLYMELVPGGTLQAAAVAARGVPPERRSGNLLLELVDRQLAGHRLPPHPDPARRPPASMTWCETVCWLGMQLASALSYAHEKGVVHRDVKPANVLLTESGTPKLADFNISYSSKLDGAAPAAFFGGSLAYMSPEQMDACNPHHPGRPEELDGRSDLYSLGMTLWELLTGLRPFQDEVVTGDWAATLANFSRQRREGIGAEALAQLPREMPPSLRATLLRCLEADPAARPQSARELQGQLWLASRPRLEQLLYPAPGGLSDVFHRYPTTVTVLAGVLPNAVLSVLAIAYNASRLAEAGEVLMVINGFFYCLAAGVGLRAAWPVLKALRAPDRRAEGPTRWKSLTLADWVAAVTMACWAVAGAAFPACLHARGALLEQEEYLSFYLHFIASNLLSGVIAGGLCFFLLTFLAVRFTFPRLLARTLPERDDFPKLRALEHRVASYGQVAIAAPFISLVLLGFTSGGGFRWAFAGLAAIGFSAFAASFWLSPRIKDDLEALLAPAAESVR
jgi:serine/threonine protein kinase